MIISRGRIYDNKEQDMLLSGLEDEITQTLASRTLSTETVVNAIEKLCKKLENGDFDDIIQSLPIDGAEKYKALAIKMLSKESIEFKLKTELGSDYLKEYDTDPPAGLGRLHKCARPLGVLMHIAAGNMDGLPAFSLAEGLLTGNINILKLPQADNGLSVTIIAELIKAEPSLADYIYVFDTPSSDIAAMKKMAEVSDGIVVWGGEAAVAAVRKLAPVGAKLIEWGHKLSFAYISGYENKDMELSALAEHIIRTKGLLCSSCQVIYIDTNNYDDVLNFCRQFFPVLENEAKKHLPQTIDSRAELTLRKYTDTLEGFLSGSEKQEFRSAFCSLVPCSDSELELSDMFGSCLVKPLPQSELVRVLRRKKGYLQAAGLICTSEKREMLSGLLERCGVVRVMSAGNMSEAFPGEAHDGEYPLRRYMRITDREII